MIRKKALAGVATAAAALVLLAGCANQTGTTGGSTSTGSGKVNVPAVTSVETPKNAVLPAGDGKATCPSTTDHRLHRRRDRPQRPARHQHLQRHPARHQPAQQGQPRLPGAVQEVRHRGRPEQGHRPRHPGGQRGRHHRRRRPAVLGRVQGHRQHLRAAGPGPHHAVGDQPGPDQERLDDLLPRPRQRRRAGPGGREVPDRTSCRPRRSTWSRTTPTTASASAPRPRRRSAARSSAPTR